MRHVSAKALGLIGGGTGLAVIAAVLVLASGGTAAGKNICSVPSPTSASCVTELAAPHFISPGADALSVTKFKNESGNGGSTATHVVIAVNFSPTVDVKSITLLVNGSPADVTGCTPNGAATGVSTVTCPVVNIAGGGTAKLTVRFAASTNTTLAGTATYGEGSGTPGQPNNSTQGNTDTLTVSSNASGGCFDLGPNDLTTVTGSLGSVQETDATVGKTSDNSLPCTFADAGVLPNTSAFVAEGTLKSQISFVEFPFLASGLATVKIFFTPLPTGVTLNKLKLLEDTNYKPLFFTTYVTVPDCDKKGNIPGTVGVPALGATDAVAHSNDSCIFKRSPLQGGGGELDLHSIGSPPDSHFGT